MGTQKVRLKENLLELKWVFQKDIEMDLTKATQKEAP